MTDEKKIYKPILARLVLSIVGASYIYHGFDLRRAIADDKQALADLQDVIFTAQKYFEEECNIAENRGLPRISLDWEIPDLAVEIMALPQNEKSPASQTKAS